VTQLEEMVVAMYEYLNDFRTRTAALAIPKTTPVTDEVSYRYEHLRGAIKEVVASAKRLPTQAAAPQPRPDVLPVAPSVRLRALVRPHAPDSEEAPRRLFCPFGFYCR
jgi:hypothetical protein